MNQLRKDRKGGQLNISMLASFLQKWLLPRLPDLNARHPDVELRIHTDRANVDFSRSDFHAAIRLGAGCVQGRAQREDDGRMAGRGGIAGPLRQVRPIRASTISDNFPDAVGRSSAPTNPGFTGSKSAANAPPAVRGSVLDDSVSVIAAAEQGLGYRDGALEPGGGGAAGRDGCRLASPVALPYRWSYYFVCPKSYRSHAEDGGLPRLAAQGCQGIPGAPGSRSDAQRARPCGRLDTRDCAARWRASQRRSRRLQSSSLAPGARPRPLGQAL